MHVITFSRLSYNSFVYFTRSYRIFIHCKIERNIHEKLNRLLKSTMCFPVWTYCEHLNVRWQHLSSIENTRAFTLTSGTNSGEIPETLEYFVHFTVISSVLIVPRLTNARNSTSLCNSSDFKMNYANENAVSVAGINLTRTVK